jgi:hypothetical protein
MLPDLSTLSIGVHYPEGLNYAVGLDKDGNRVEKRTRGGRSRAPLKQCSDVCVICLEDLSNPSTVPSATETVTNTEAGWNDKERSPPGRLQIDVFRDTCDHGFHTNCAIVWLSDAYAESPPDKNPPCPMCRESVSTADVAALKGARNKKLFANLVKAATERRELREEEETRELREQQRLSDEEWERQQLEVRQEASHGDYDAGYSSDDSSDIRRRIAWNEQRALNQALDHDVKEWLRGSEEERRAVERRRGGSITDWDTSNVTDMSKLFSHARGFNKPLRWNTGKVTNMSSMFDFADSFNNGGEPLAWDTKNVTNMEEMFKEANAFNQPLVGWDVSKVVNMDHMFLYTMAFNQPLSWNTRRVRSMDGMFAQTEVFNKTLTFDTRSLETTNGMFYHAKAFNNGGQPLAWNMRKVYDMTEMFDNAISFNNGGQPLKWDTRSVGLMRNMFNDATVFNQELEWDTRAVRDMTAMFSGATAFNNGGEPLHWDTRNVTDMSYMFLDAENFDQALAWDIRGLRGYPGNRLRMFVGSDGRFNTNQRCIRETAAISARLREEWDQNYTYLESDEDDESS